MTREEASKILQGLKMLSETKRCEIALDMAISALENNREWIPVTKWLPQKPYACWVTIWDTNILTQEEFENVLPYPVGYDGETWNDEDGNICPFEVIAWMPTPKPYKVESENI